MEACLKWFLPEQEALDPYRAGGRDPLKDGAPSLSQLCFILWYFGTSNDVKFQSGHILSCSCF